MTINNHYHHSLKCIRTESCIDYARSEVEKDIKSLVEKTMKYIEMEDPHYFDDDSRRTIAFVRGGKGYYSYFSVVSNTLSAEEYKKAFVDKLTEFFTEAVEFVYEDVRCDLLESGHEYGNRECEWTLFLPMNDGEIIIEFNSQEDQHDIPQHTLNIVSEEKD